MFAGRWSLFWLFALNAAFNLILRPIFLPIPTSGMLESAYLGREWQLGYYKHPPLSSWVVSGFEFLFGSNVFAYYLLPQIYLILVLFVAFKLAREFVSERHAILAVFILSLYPYFSIKSNIFDADTIIVLPFVASLYFYSRFLKENRYIFAILFGLFIGLGLLGKYFFIVSAISFGIHAIFYAKQYRNPKLYVAGLIAFLVFLPNLYWLFKHNFISFNYARNIVIAGDPELRGFSSPIKFISIQCANLAIAILIAWVVFWQKPRFRKLKDIILKPTFLEYFSIFTIVILFVLMVLTSSYGKSRFLKPLIVILPIYAVSLYRDKEISNKKFIYISIIFFTIISTMYFFEIFRESSKNKHENRDYISLTKKIQEEWWKECGKKPIKYLLIDGGYSIGSAVAFYLNPHPTVIPYMDFKKAALYSSEEKYMEEGGVTMYENSLRTYLFYEKDEQIRNDKFKTSIFKLKNIRNNHYTVFEVGFNCGKAV